MEPAHPSDRRFREVPQVYGRRQHGFLGLIGHGRLAAFHIFALHEQLRRSAGATVLRVVPNGSGRSQAVESDNGMKRHRRHSQPSPCFYRLSAAVKIFNSFGRAEVGAGFGGIILRPFTPRHSTPPRAGRRSRLPRSDGYVGVFAGLYGPLPRSPRRNLRAGEESTGCGSITSGVDTHTALSASIYTLTAGLIAVCSGALAAG